VGRVGQGVYGQGSGFILDEDGTAITTNHVVTGARYLNVYVEGEEDPLPAAVLGVSECFDLALIDIEGGGYPDIEWGGGEIESGLDVTALGYPAEDIAAGEQPDQTATKGTINVTKASDATYSASVESVNRPKAVIIAKHQAPLRLGMSGGPLVSEELEAVGINLSAGETDQSWAISRDVAKPLIKDLRRGSDVASIGVNGEANTDSEGGPPGILVASVDSGSSAQEVGVQEVGSSEKTSDLIHVDFITKLGESRFTEDKTMKTYCDILHTHTADQPLDIEVERWTFDETEEPIGLDLYEGVLQREPLQKNKSKTKERLSQLSRQGVLPKDCADANNNGICDSEETMRGAKASPQPTASPSAGTTGISSASAAPATQPPEAPPTNQGASSVTPSPAPPSEP
jgi:serine protease Do